MLFTDLAGFTSMTERLDPEEVQAITGEIFAAVSEVVARYQGSVESFSGDGALVLFGVPRAHEDDPIRAVRTAIEIHNRVAAISPRHEPKIGCPLAMHSGVNSGLAVVGNRDPEAGTHGVVGDVVNTASRLSGLAASGQILAGAETWRRSTGHFDFETLAPVSVKGKAEPVEVYRVIGIKNTPFKTHGLSGISAEIIGRDRELETLRGAIRDLRSGKRSVVSICGEPGTGKSRLIEEFKSGLDLGEIQWHQGYAYAYSENTPYAPVMDLLSRAFGIEDRDGAAVIRLKIESSLTRILDGDQATTPYVGNLYSLTYPETEKMSPESWKPRLFEAIARILEALCRRGPTVICIEDIHWADPSSLDLLRHLIDHVEAPYLLLLVHRPFDIDLPRQIEIQLEKLSASDAQLMIASLLKTEDVPAELRGFIERKVEGNPFYLEEVVNELLQSGTLVRENGRWRLTRPLEEADLPPTVQAVITARLDRLESDMKRILQEAAVIGRAFLGEILKKITRIGTAIDAHLFGLETLDLVRRRALEPELEYIFKHALTQEVAYSGLLRTDRRDIHERIAVVMERLLGDRLTEFYETLAFHYARGHSQFKAVEYLMKSGWKSLHRFALEESHRYYSEAYRILMELPSESKEANALLMDLLAQWGRVYYYKGDFNGLHDLLVPLRARALGLGDKVRLATYNFSLAVALGWQCRWREAHDLASEALDLGEQTENSAVIAYASMWLSWICSDRGDLEESLRYGLRAVDLCNTKVADRWLRAKSVGGVGIAYLYMGDLCKFDEHNAAIRRAAEENADARAFVLAHIGSAMRHQLAGDNDAAMQEAREGLRKAKDPLYSVYALALLAKCEALVGNLDRALEMCERVIENSDRHGTELLTATALSSWAHVLVARGQVPDGISRMEEAIRICADQGRRFYECTHTLLLGQIYLAIAKGENRGLRAAVRHPGFVIRHVLPAARKSETHLRRSMDLAEEMGARLMLGRALYELGRLSLATRRPDQAREHLARAADLFELCGAAFLLEKARGELASLDPGSRKHPGWRTAQRG